MPSLPEREPNKLILCFDGTGNTFSGSNGDTNVAKILNKLDRNNAKQYHYYQTGIGTYVINEKSVNRGFIGNQVASISKVLDQGFATTFDAHVIAGYRFLMRYYEPGDKIYMFGFSRGAFTAKFLTHMISKVGLLCKGNEEMVPFAYLLYQRWLKETTAQQGVLHNQGTCQTNDRTPLAAGTESEPPQLTPHELVSAEVEGFKTTFCKKDPPKPGQEEGGDIKVFFLGMWDCVSSVSVLEASSPVPLPVSGAAKYVRHAVSVDERRVKFKPALLVQDIETNTDDTEDDAEVVTEDGAMVARKKDPVVGVKEVWFPGNHGDVGGGWPIEMQEAKAAVKNIEEPKEAEQKRKSWWYWLKSFSLKKILFTKKPIKPSLDPRKDAFQLSDISLDWMIRELDFINASHPLEGVKWGLNRNGFRSKFRQPERNIQALSGPIHDTLRVGRGCAIVKVLFWKFLEFWPFTSRWELEGDKWVNTQFPLNKGSFRDIPKTAVLHSSVLWRLENDPEYHPRNNHGGSSAMCLKKKGSSWAEVVEDEPALKRDEQHVLYRFRES